jgi:hypothetical protein
MIGPQQINPNKRRWTMSNQTGFKGGTSSTEVEAIHQAVLNYIEAWYQGDPERGLKSLHPDLAKRIIRTSPESGQDTLENMSATKLTERWGSGQGKATPLENQKKEVTILDIHGFMASVKLEAAAWVDYMQLAKFNGRWVIVNILWELKN